MPPAKTPGEDTTQTLAYWMGRVEASLNGLKETFDKFTAKEDGSWREFGAWRRDVDARLVKGSENFLEINRRITDLESVRCPLGADCPAIHNLREKDQAKVEKPGFGSWAWFRDGYLDKVVIALFTAGVFVLIQLIIQHQIPIK